MSTSSPVFDQYTKSAFVSNGITFTILPLIFVGLRFYARCRTRIAMGPGNHFGKLISTAVRTLRSL